MIGLILELLRLIFLLACGGLAILFAALAIVRRKKRRRVVAYGIAAVVFLVASYFLWRINLTSWETTDRETATLAFKQNFGFDPPASVGEIRVKNYGIYDSFVHWMSFTYDSAVLNKILRQDQSLDTAYIGTHEYQQIAYDLKQGCENCPKWLELPTANTSQIFFKKNFLKHSFSEYHLWVDDKQRMVYLEVSYFD